MKKEEECGYLREKFLNYLLFCVNKEVELKMYETSLSCLKANLNAIDSNFAHLAVSNLQTPIGIEPHSIIRLGDVVSLTFNLTKK